MQESESSGLLESRLIGDHLKWLRTFGEVADRREEKLYLVGGVVRDLLLKTTPRDYDLVLDGDVDGFGAEIIKLGATIESRSQFKTIKIHFEDQILDVATSREERYNTPGALPVIKAVPIDLDLQRRDFTVNAIAISLLPDSFGELFDPHDGLVDLQKGLVEVLHEQSFRDDPTRLLRAVRYEQRLGFHIGPMTEAYVNRDKEYINSISSDRLRTEFERIFSEVECSAILQRMEDLGILRCMSHTLAWNGRLSDVYSSAIDLYDEEVSGWDIYLALIGINSDIRSIKTLAKTFNLTADQSRYLLAAAEFKRDANVIVLDAVNMSSMVFALDFVPLTILRVYALYTDDLQLLNRLGNYIENLRYVKSALQARDLLDMGVVQGPQISNILHALRSKKIDEGITEDRERSLVTGWIESASQEDMDFEGL
jgi:tRNA nucleotidyltransferase (CCA-adding enzyme)